MSENFYKMDKEGHVVDEFSNKDDFVEYYSNCYYNGGKVYDAEEIANSQIKMVEGKFIDYLKNGRELIVCADYLDKILEILAWKTGKINYKESYKVYEDVKLAYLGNWEKVICILKKYYDEWVEKPFGVCYFHSGQNRFNILQLCDFLKVHLPQRFKGQRMNKDFWDTIVIGGILDDVRKTSGIGLVYMITLVYFLSGGFFPIYDKFAAVALKAIQENKKPSKGKQEIIIYEGVPDKNDKMAAEFLSLKGNKLSDGRSYEWYVHSINKIFKCHYMGYDGETYFNKDVKQNISEERKVDQALWQYGHFFQIHQIKYQ